MGRPPGKEKIAHVPGVVVRTIGARGELFLGNLNQLGKISSRLFSITGLSAPRTAELMKAAEAMVHSLETHHLTEQLAFPALIEYALVTGMAYRTSTCWEPWRRLRTRLLRGGAVLPQNVLTVVTEATYHPAGLDADVRLQMSIFMRLIGQPCHVLSACESAVNVVLRETR